MIFLFLFLSRSHWYIAVICFPWLEKVIYKDCESQHLPQSDFQQFPHQSESDNGTIRKESVLVLNDIWYDTEEQDIKSNLHHEGNDLRICTGFFFKKKDLYVKLLEINE